MANVEPGCVASLRRPLQFKLLLGNRTLPEIKVDQALIRHPNFFREFFEVLNGWLVQANGDLAL
ncbi:hypothetical protein D3C83_146520 [compost metagenome]